MRLKSIFALFAAGLSSASAAENRATNGTAIGSPAIYNTRETNATFLPANQAAKTFQLPPGFHVSVFASEPDVQQPIGMTMDSRGRLWVCENYTYAERPRGWD